MSDLSKKLLFAAFALFMLVAILDTLIPDQVVEYKTRVKTKVVHDTVVEKEAIVPDECLELVDGANRLADKSIYLVTVNDELIELISEIRVAKAGDDSKRLVKISEELSAHSEKADSVFAEITDLRRLRTTQQAACKMSLR